MLTINVPDTEFFIKETLEFVNVKGTKLQLEHSLVSVSKWEAKYHKPFLTSEKNAEEILEYVKCMTITQNVDPNIYFCLTEKNIKEIKDYIEDPMTATTFYNKGRKEGDSKHVKPQTSETIYCSMILLNIPVEFQKWHLNRLMTLIKVCDAANRPKNKMSQREVIRQYADLNEQRKKALGTKG